MAEITNSKVRKLAFFMAAILLLAVISSGFSREDRREIAISLHNQGVKEMQSKDYAFAAELFEESLEYTEEPITRELLGDAYYFLNDLGKAEENWRRAVTAKSMDRVNKKLEKLRREKRAAEGLESFSAGNFYIRFSEEADDLSLPELDETLRTAYRELCSDFGHFLRQKPAVIIYPLEKFRQLSDSPHFTAGFFDGKIRLPERTGEEIDILDVKKTIWHEMTHAFINDITGNKCSVWLQEGLAQYEENKIKPVDMDLFNVSVDKKYLLSIGELVNNDINQNDGVEVMLFYQQSFSLTNFLIQKYGMKALREILSLMGEGADFEFALQQVTGLDLPTLEVKWLASLEDDIWVKE